MPNLNMKILLVDDFATMRKIVRNILKQLGYNNMDEAEDGNAAFAKLKLQPFDMIISDWNMPNCTGIELLKKVRADDALKKIPFLMVTGEAEKTQVMEAIKAGVSNYVVKPFTAEGLKVKLAQIFKE